MATSLLLSRTLTINPILAKAIGLNESIVLQQISYWLERSDNWYNGRRWVWNTHSEWQDQFCWMSESTIKRTFKNLKQKGYIETKFLSPNKADRTLWYTINFTLLSELEKTIHEQQMKELSEQGNELTAKEETQPDLFSNDQDATSQDSQTKTVSRFDEFWEAYPKKAGKKKCQAKWKARKLDSMAERIIQDVLERVEKDYNWTRGFSPNPETYLNGDRWNDDIQYAPEALPMAVHSAPGNAANIDPLMGHFNTAKKRVNHDAGK